jgi:KDO2-lipid IV(A) lauroyltransferase
MRMDRKQVTDWLLYLVVRGFVCLVQTWRMETCQSLSRFLAWFACDVCAMRGDVLDENLRTAFPHWDKAERRRVGRAMWEHLFLMMCEIAHAPRKIHRRNWHQYVSIPTKRELVRYLLDPRPIVMVSGHFGNFEMGGYIAGLLGFPSYTVARTLDNPYLDQFVRRFREANGQFILPKTGSAAQVDEVLKSGGLLIALGDQHAGPKGCWVEFFGRPASYHKAIALFPLMHGAPLLLVQTRRTNLPLHFEIGLLDVADPKTMSSRLQSVPALTSWYNQALEAMIREAPEQYWWVHRRWKGEPPRRRRAAVQAA